MRLPSRFSRAAVAVLLALGLAACVAATADRQALSGNAERPPNIIIFYADDLGYGDLGSYGAQGLPTPNVDRLAAEGVRFTDAHAAAATCTIESPRGPMVVAPSKRLAGSRGTCGS